MAHDGDDTNPPKRKIRTVTLQQALAKQDAEQAKEIRGWASRIRDGLADTAYRTRVLDVCDDMDRAASVVETYAAELLERLEREGAR